MSGAGAPNIDVQLPGAKVAIVASLWHRVVMDGLIEGAKTSLNRAGAKFEVFEVPGSFELPLGAQMAIDAGFDAVVALGVIIRGGTPHFEYVCSAATEGISRLSLSSGVPIGFGLLTCDTEDQALDRAGLEGSTESKGEEAATAALLMLNLSKQFS